MRKIKEWYIEAPWGNIAMIAWGNEAGRKILLGHGLQCNAASFIPLLELLPDTCHYVAYDLPGHGRSDTFPAGVNMTRMHMVPAFIKIVEDLDWHKFALIGHSLSAELACYYNALRPGKLTEIVMLDPGPPFIKLSFREWYKHFYEKHYTHYKKLPKKPKLYTREGAVDAIVKARPGMKKQVANVILSRSLVPAGDGKYTLSWDPRLRNLATLNETYRFDWELFKKLPPTLGIVTDSHKKLTRSSRRFLRSCAQTVDNFRTVQVSGCHDVHITNPEKVLPFICQFLGITRAKL